jgi:hypothetical protein
VPDHLVPDDVVVEGGFVTEGSPVQSGDLLPGTDDHGLPVREGSPEECAQFEDDVVFGKVGSLTDD